MGYSLLLSSNSFVNEMAVYIIFREGCSGHHRTAKRGSWPAVRLFKPRNLHIQLSQFKPFDLACD